jgi:plastocyanin
VKSPKGRKFGMSTAQSLSVVLILILAIVAFAYISTSFAQTNEIDSLQAQLNAVRGEVNSSQTNLSSLQTKLSNLPTMDQKPTIRNIKVEWTNTLNSAQDRFYLPMITVNQGDTLDITFVSNDTDAHTFTLESPYNFQINATVPGTRDYLQNESVFTTAATGNSPGVKVFGSPGNVTGTGSFVAKYSGIYEYFCIYHVQLGMFGYLVVLPNAAYNVSSPSVTPTNSSRVVAVNIVNGAAGNTSSNGFSPPTITLVIGVNNTVVWTNNDNFPHTVTANDGNFSSGNMNPGDIFTWTFTTPGTFAYHCSYHPWMKGTVIVESS